MSLPFIKIPILYDIQTLEILKDVEFFNSTLSKSEFYKHNYKDLRGLLFSLGDDLRSDFIGSFLFGDYLWAM